MSYNNLNEKIFDDLRNYDLKSAYKPIEQKFYQSINDSRAIIDNIRDENNNQTIQTLREIKANSTTKTLIRQLHTEYQQFKDDIPKKAKETNAEIDRVKTQVKDNTTREKLIANEVNKFKTYVKGKLKRLDNLASRIQSRVENVQTEFTNVKTSINNEIQEVRNNIQNKLNQIETNVHETLSAPEQLTHDIDNQLQKIESSYEKFQSIITDPIEKICNAINNVIDKINSIIDEIPKSIGFNIGLDLSGFIHIDKFDLLDTSNAKTIDQIIHNLTDIYNSLINSLKDPCKLFEFRGCDIKSNLFNILSSALKQTLQELLDIPESILALLFSYINQIIQLLNSIIELINALFANLKFNFGLSLNIQADLLKKLDLGSLLCSGGHIRSAKDLLNLGIPNINANINVSSNYGSLINDSIKPPARILKNVHIKLF